MECCILGTPLLYIAQLYKNVPSPQYLFLKFLLTRMPEIWIAQTVYMLTNIIWIIDCAFNLSDNCIYTSFSDVTP